MAHAGSDGKTGTEIIVEHFREKYRPAFRAGNLIRCHDGEWVAMGVACEVSTTALLAKLATATDAPELPKSAGGGVKRDALPGFFKKWAKVAWGDLLDSLPDEDTAELGGDSNAGDEFRRLVRNALLTEVVLSNNISTRDEVTQVERRSLIDWCVKFAKPGPWKSIRSKKCWCRIIVKPEGELLLQVAVRHELFSQLRADRRLCEMTTNKFSARAERYGVGRTSRDERPHGQTAVVLDSTFLATLTEGIHLTAEDLDETAHNTAPVNVVLREERPNSNGKDLVNNPLTSPRLEADQIPCGKDSTEVTNKTDHRSIWFLGPNATRKNASVYAPDNSFLQGDDPDDLAERYEVEGIGLYGGG